MLPPFLEESNRPHHEEITNNLRAMRAELIRVLHTGRRFDGRSTTPSVASPLMREVMEMASHGGLSGEEAFLVLAYESLNMIERMGDQMLEFQLTQPHPTLRTKLRGGLQRSNTWI